MKRTLHFAPVAGLAAVCALAASGARTPAFAEDTKPCYNGTPQVCFVQEICTQVGWTATLYPPSFGQTCLSKTVETYYWSTTTTSTSSDGTTTKPPSTTLK
jgi:hypothetical protein